MNSFMRKQAQTVKPQKGKLLLLAVLVITGVVIAAVQWASSPAAIASSDKPVVTNPVKSADASLVRLHREPVDLTVHWQVEIRQDLFEQERIVRVATPAAEIPDAAAILAHVRQSLRLQAIMLDQQPRALINGQLCKPGSTILGYELQAISARQVILTRQGVSVPLSL